MLPTYSDWPIWVYVDAEYFGHPQNKERGLSETSELVHYGVFTQNTLT